MTGEQKSKSKHTMSAARKARYTSYRALHIREKRKLKRVLQSSGKEAARAYADKHGLTSLLAQLMASRPVVSKIAV